MGPLAAAAVAVGRAGATVRSRRQDSRPSSSRSTSDRHCDGVIGSTPTDNIPVFRSAFLSRMSRRRTAAPAFKISAGRQHIRPPRVSHWQALSVSRCTHKGRTQAGPRQVLETQAGRQAGRQRDALIPHPHTPTASAQFFLRVCARGITYTNCISMRMPDARDAAFRVGRRSYSPALRRHIRIFPCVCECETAW